MKTLGRLTAVCAVLALAGATVIAFNDADAQEQASQLKAPRSSSQGLVLGAGDGAQPETMEQFLTAVTKDVDSYWTKVFESSGVDEPRVSYAWIPSGQTAQSACGADAMGDSAAAYCPGDDTIYISEKFATDIYNGALDQALPGSSQGFGRTAGDFAVAYIVAHEYGHQIQHELGLFDQYGQQVPTSAFELQADCYAGTWANSAYQENRLEDGDVQEALDAALAVGRLQLLRSRPPRHARAARRGLERRLRVRRPVGLQSVPERLTSPAARPESRKLEARAFGVPPRTGHGMPSGTNSSAGCLTRI